MTFERQTRRTAKPIRRDDGGYGQLSDPYGEREDQPEPESCLSFASLYRRAQGFDYEASTACFNGAFSLFGCLPVLPGPCGMYRFAGMYDVDKRKERATETLKSTAISLQSMIGQVTRFMALNALTRNSATKGFNRYEICRSQVQPFLVTLPSSTNIAAKPVADGTRAADPTHGPEMKDRLARYHQQLTDLRSYQDQKRRQNRIRPSIDIHTDEKKIGNAEAAGIAKPSESYENRPLLQHRREQNLSIDIQKPTPPLPKALSAIELAVANERSKSESEQMRTALKNWNDKLVLWFVLLDNHRTKLNDLRLLLKTSSKAVQARLKLPSAADDSEGAERRRDLRVRLAELTESETILRARLADFPDAINEFESHAQLSAWLLFGVQFDVGSDALEGLSIDPEDGPRSPSIVSPLACLRMDARSSSTAVDWRSITVDGVPAADVAKLSRQEIQQRLTDHWKKAGGRNRQRRQLRLAAAIERRLAAVRARREFEQQNPVDAVDYYLSKVEQNPSECGMMVATLLLAEDRILSYGVVLKGEGLVTAYVPNATFYFEAETKETSFLTQRRRWINGSMAGYLFIFLGLAELWRSNAQFRTKIGLSILVPLQLILYAVVSLSPAIFALGLRSSLQSTFADSPQNYLDLVLLMYVGVYGLFITVHIYSESVARVVPWTFRVLTVFNGILAPWMLFYLVRTSIGHVQQLFVPDSIGTDGTLISTIVTWLALANFALPIVLSALHGIPQLIFMAVSIVHFLVFLPSFISGLSIYAVIRTFDLSWYVFAFGFVRRLSS